MPAALLPPILIADDDADDQFLLRRALQKANVANPIVTFNDGDDLLQFLNDSHAESDGHGAPPCLLFLDLNMPRMTGFDVLANLARARLGRRLKTVVVSSSSREEDAERAKRLGASEYLIKFPAPQTFGRIVAEALQKFDAVERRSAPQDAA